MNNNNIIIIEINSSWHRTRVLFDTSYKQNKFMGMYFDVRVCISRLK